MKHPFSIPLVAIFVLHAQASAFRFIDQSRSAGIQRPYGRTNKHGGPSVADLDADGWPDLLLGHHTGHVEIYFNNRDGTFTKAPFSARHDIHALTAFRFSARSSGMHFSITRGGSRGTSPQYPRMFRVGADRSIEDVSDSAGATNIRGRGRSALYVNLSARKTVHPDMLFTSAQSQINSGPHQQAMRGGAGPLFRKERIEGFGTNPNHDVAPTDVDGDGVIEIISFHDLCIHKLTSPFTLRNISASTLPRDMQLDGTNAVAELDYDNDGRWDLFVARSATGNLDWLEYRRGNRIQDVLLRNVGGRYVDVTSEANIATSGGTRGVTVGDFNNDGWIDIALVKYGPEADTVLINKGDGTFRAVPAGFRRKPSVRGDGATAVDYDRDGRLDVVLSEGAWSGESNVGFFRVMRNVMALDDTKNYVHVRVGSSPSQTAVSMHAVVTVRAGRLQMMRRVGAPGVASSISYIETVHFGLGPQRMASEVIVRWTDGERRTVQNVRAGSVVTMGNI